MPRMSLSFLDLVTCSLGSMLLLFLIILMMTKQWSFASAPSRLDGSGESESPFVVVVTAGDDEDEAVSIAQPISFSGTWAQSRRKDEAPDFAVLYSTTSPPPGSLLHLNVPGKLDVVVQVFFNGKRQFTRRLASKSSERRVRIWPWSVHSKAKEADK